MRAALFALAVAVVMACSSATGPRMQVAGTVQFNALEGGFYAIRGDDGVTYDPTNLPACYKADGLRVEVTFKVRRDLVSFHMVGPLVDLLSINSPGRIC